MGIDEHFTSVNQSGREPICCGHQYVQPDTEALPKTKRGFHPSQDSGWPFWRSITRGQGSPHGRFLGVPSVSARTSTSDTGPLGR